MDHGVKRQKAVDESAEVVAARRAKETKRIDAYTAATSDLYRRKADRDVSEDALAAVTRVLELNPEHPSAWNYRRRALLALLAEADPAVKQARLADDLDLTSYSLKRNPKNYAVWEHRKWLLRTMPDPDWSFELKMVEVQLEKDARNFHAWDYRRHVVASCRRADGPASPKRPRLTAASELAFTTRKIEASFSNFSAWHYRSKLLPRLWAERGDDDAVDEAARLARLDDEFNLVLQALYTDPNDQSGWLYHRWLVGRGTEPVLRRELAALAELREMEPDSRWCIDAVAHYRSLLVAELGPDHAETAELRGSIAADYARLQTLDPDRARRYADHELAASV